jgi:hypothetical protein
MATKLRKLVIDEISLVDKGANPGAHIVMFKRRTKPEDETGRHGRAPKDRDDQNFRAGGSGPSTEALWVKFDDYRREMMPRAAFSRAWSELSAGEKQAVRDEEAEAAAAREAAAAAEQAERQNQLADVMVKGAHAVARGELENTVRKSTWHSALRKMAAERQEQGESIERAVARLVQSDADALALLKASLSGVVDDVTPAPVAHAPVLKLNSAYSQLKKIASDIRAEHPELTAGAAFVRAYNENPELASRSKTEQAFA